MTRLDIQLLQIVLDDLEASVPALLEATQTEASLFTPLCRVSHARSLLAGLLNIVKKEAV